MQPGHSLHQAGPPEAGWEVLPAIFGELSAIARSNKCGQRSEQPGASVEDTGSAFLPGVSERWAEGSCKGDPPRSPAKGHHLLGTAPGAGGGDGRPVSVYISYMAVCTVTQVWNFD